MSKSNTPERFSLSALRLAVGAAVCALNHAPGFTSAGAAGKIKMPIVGAIRWDAYFSQPGEAAFEDPNFGIVTRTTTNDMSPKKWHYRVPFFGKEINDTAILANGNTPEVMGQELQYAQDHGIKFWSFCNYPIGCKEKHPPASACPGIQCCADNVGLSCVFYPCACSGPTPLAPCRLSLLPLVAASRGCRSLLPLVAVQIRALAVAQ